MANSVGNTASQKIIDNNNKQLANFQALTANSTAVSDAQTIAQSDNATNRAQNSSAISLLNGSLADAKAFNQTNSQAA